MTGVDELSFEEEVRDEVKGLFILELRDEELTGLVDVLELLELLELLVDVDEVLDEVLNEVLNELLLELLDDELDEPDPATKVTAVGRPGAACAKDRAARSAMRIVCILLVQSPSEKVNVKRPATG